MIHLLQLLKIVLTPQTLILILWLQYKESAYLLMCLFIFSLWNLLYFLLYQDEEMSALDQLRERICKRKVELKKQREKEKRKKREVQRIRKEVFRTIGAFYIEQLASRLPFVVKKSSESFEKKNVEREIFEVL